MFADQRVIIKNRALKNSIETAALPNVLNIFYTYAFAFSIKKCYRLSLRIIKIITLIVSIIPTITLRLQVPKLYKQQTKHLLLNTSDVKENTLWLNFFRLIET